MVKLMVFDTGAIQGRSLTTWDIPGPWDISWAFGLHFRMQCMLILALRTSHSQPQRRSHPEEIFPLLQKESSSE